MEQVKIGHEEEHKVAEELMKFGHFENIAKRLSLAGSSSGRF